MLVRNYHLPLLLVVIISCFPVFLWTDNSTEQERLYQFLEQFQWSPRGDYKHLDLMRSTARLGLTQQRILKINPNDDWLDGVLMTVIESYDSNLFRKNRKIASTILREASAILAQTSNVFSGSKLELAGSAFEGTSVGDLADIDSFVVLAPHLNEQLRIYSTDDGGNSYAIKLRQGVDRAKFVSDYPDLADMVTPKGALNLLLFKKWTFGLMTGALVAAFRNHPIQRSRVYQGVAAVGADIESRVGHFYSIDFVPTIGLSTSGLRLKREESCRCRLLSKCQNLDLTTDHNEDDSVHAANHYFNPGWFLVSLHNVSVPSHGDQDEFSGVAGTHLLERRILRSSIVFRHLNRLLKVLNSARSWRLPSFVFKHLLFAAYEDTCQMSAWQQGKIGQLLTICLRKLSSAIENDRLDEYFLEARSNLLYLPHRKLPLYPIINKDVKFVLRKLNMGKISEILDLFRINNINDNIQSK